jgi:uncharacterized protein (DUF2236 family)
MITHRVNAERVVLLGWSRAILLQLAHPLVAAGIADHSGFRGGAVAAAGRLHQTVRAMLNLAFGDRAAAQATIARIRAIHRRVHGELREPAGPFPAGHPYSADDPALLLWVHATLIESVLLAYEQLVEPLSDADRDQYCQDSAAVPIALGARDSEVPRSWAALRRYMDGVSESGVLAVSADARVLSRAILYPPMRAITGPLGWINRSVTLGLLPDGIRAQYGFTWSRPQDRRLFLVMRLVRLVRRAVPFGWERWPEARSVRPPRGGLEAVLRP